jgi:hypothetical protein
VPSGAAETLTARHRPRNAGPGPARRPRVRSARGEYNETVLPVITRVMLMNIGYPANSAVASLAVLMYVIIANYILVLTFSARNAGLFKIYRDWQTARPIPWLDQASRGPDPASFGY